MDPLALPGPEFLALYLLLCLVVVTAVAWARRGGEPGEAEVPDVEPDAYDLAALRGGAQEALRVAAFVLLERGALERTAEGLRSLSPGASGRHAIEREVLRVFEQPRPVAELFSAQSVEVCKGVEERLVAQGLLPNEAQQDRRQVIAIAAQLTLLSVAGAKLVVALSTGHGNVWLLIGACLLGCGLCRWVAAPRRTPAGDALLRRMQADLEEARTSRPRSDTPAETSVRLAAAFGLGALPSALYPWLHQTFPKMGGASCGGGGCGGGGGGGGGGCGGCGGCGG